MGVLLQAVSRVLRLFRSVTVPGANATTTLFTGLPCSGSGTLRVWCFVAGTAVTINVLQKSASGNPRTGATAPASSYRQTDTRTVSASGTDMSPLDFTIRGDYVRIDVVLTTAPTTFEFMASLLP